MLNHRKRIVVHFDRLRPFKGDIQETSPKGSNQSVEGHLPPSSQLPTSHTLTLYDDGDGEEDNEESPASPAITQRYPNRTRRAPARFDDYISH